jgi:hypothetical protein
MKLVGMLCAILLSSVGRAQTEAGPWSGPHTLNRVLVPSDSAQKTNYFLPVKNSKRPKINAPLVTTDTVVDPARNFKHLKLIEQSLLSGQSDK